MAASLLGASGCVFQPGQIAGRGAPDLERVRLSFGWGEASPAQVKLAEDTHALLAEAVRAGTPLTSEAILASFDRALRGALADERWAGVLGDGSIDWYEAGLDLGDGNRLHASFDVARERGFVRVLTEIEQPSGSSVRAAVWGGGGAEPVFKTRDLPVAGFGGVRLEVGAAFENFQDLVLARLAFPGRDGKRLGVYRCFPAHQPEWTAYSFQTPQDLDEQEAALEALLARFAVDDRWFFSNPDEDLARLYQQISLVRADKSPTERVDRLLEILRVAGEEEFLASLASVRFPDGPVLTVTRQQFHRPMIRVEVGEDPVRLTYLFPGALGVAYDSGPIPRRFLERARQDESFNFGTFLPDLWRGENEELFVDVYRMNRARALAAGGGAVDEQRLFERTVRDLAGIGTSWEAETVRIGGKQFEIRITESDIEALWSGLDRAGGAAQTLPRGARAAMPAPGAASWRLERYQEGGLTFYRDGSLVYYEVEPDDAGSDGGLDAVRRKLRTRLPGRYDYPLAFSGFRDEHLAPGLLLVIPEPQEIRVIGSARLRALVDAACREESYDYPELVYALVWNESRAGIDNFFRFEEGRLDAVARMRSELRGPERERFEALFGRFGALLAGSYGPGHVLYETAWAMGFRGSPGELADPAVNLRYVARYLAVNGIDRSASIERVSRIYNGPAHARNGYSLRLERNLARAARAYATAQSASGG
ncbi:MAG: hypothetical protein U0610_09745 [bacterium]